MKKVYITTPAYYPNDVAHIGHAYTTIAADALARWYRLKIDKKNVMFISGLDEHGEKLEKAAHEVGMDPQKFVDMMAEKFQDTWKTLNISYDGFIRTSEVRHIKVVEKIFKKIYENGDIYKGSYEGWYCTPCESYWTEMQSVDGKCPQCSREVKKLKEESYFFKLSKYQDKLLDLYKNNPGFISPENREKEVINRVKEGLRDLSISRKKVKWGIPIPIDKELTLYVWLDALSFYISVLDYPKEKFKKFWPPDVQLMGKEILWFHSVILPALLMSAKFPLPKRIFAHGWLTINGQKMSKSLGNVINPLYLSQKYGVDSLRYFLLREIPFGEDGDFSEEALVSRINNELANDLGNLLNRTIVMINSYLNGNIPKKTKDEISKHLDFKKIDSYIEKRELHNALNEIWRFINFANKYINDKTPWSIKDKKELEVVLYNLAESLRFIAILLKPFMPQTSAEIASQLGIKEFGKQGFKQLKFGLLRGKVSKPKILFKKIELRFDKPEEVSKMENVVLFDDWKKLDVRVGTIKKAEPHPNADKLVVLQVDMGEAKPRQLVAGLKQYYKPEELVGKRVVIFSNLKSVNLRGVDSDGMILAAVNNRDVVLLTTDKPINNGAKVE